jgi:3-deoxy-manno-octulosonate cytidylyltransferase (CMP-KDO synthetase)
MRVLALIPSRLQSQRLPEKPLALIGGVPMIVWVWRQAASCPQVSEAIVLTDSQEIVEAVERFGGRSLLTGPAENGTERLANTVAQYGLEADLFVNVQGDMPFIDSGSIEALINAMRDSDAGIGTLCAPIHKLDTLNNPNRPKVVLVEKGQALYFSRAAVPYSRETPLEVVEGQHFEHIGLYAFRPETLTEIVKLPISPLEEMEKLEQLRWLSAGLTIQCAVVANAPISVDTPEDLEEARAYAQENNLVAPTEA